MNTREYQIKTERLAGLRRNMANKMAAGLDYDKEAEEIIKLSAELREVGKPAKA